ncbi:SdpI family protein [Kyrpidia spormannii]|uniref:DUF1648 domain-containing protein n=2 Tax=Kyrpidia spormannii TaxID=2055160 RepID=A0A6F9DYZ2_9BACL|nr:SdpI family protein [Kyrpidia spormannii]CAB3389791.1 conserved membrane protein of unknown function [Kyrpidia spormannii]CAB3390685.1 conserved membrane protein of unknown function [Kyrpidia spormannii]
MSEAKAKWTGVDWAILVIALIPLIIAGLYWDQLPNQLAVHFDLHNRPNGFQSKGWFLVMAAGLNLGIAALMKVAMWIDPKRENYMKFSGFYQAFRLLMAAFLSGIDVVLIYYNLGQRFNIQLIVLGGIGVVFILLGNFMARIRFNYFIGIRTPWTLANEEVWRRTHRMAGPLWVAAGFLAFVSAFLPGDLAVWIFLAGTLAAALIPTIYSFVVYRRIVR